MSPRNLIVKYLDEARMMQVATCADGEPWCASVYFAVDNLHNLYWLSLPTTRHSQEIAKNPRVAGTIVLPQVYGNPVQGVQFSGTAREVGLDETESLFAGYAERYTAHARLQPILDGTDNHRLYQIKPAQFVLYDQVNFREQPRQVWDLSSE